MSSVGKRPENVLFFWTWKCTDGGGEEYFQFIWKDNWHLLQCYLRSWRNKIDLWQISIIALCKLPDTGWLGGFFSNLFKPLNTFFLCVMHIVSTPGYVQFRIQNMCRERYLLSCQVGSNIIGLWCPQVCCWWVLPFQFPLDVRGRWRNHTESFQACIYSCTFNVWASAVTYNLEKLKLLKL